MLLRFTDHEFKREMSFEILPDNKSFLDHFLTVMETGIEKKALLDDGMRAHTHKTLLAFWPSRSSAHNQI